MIRSPWIATLHLPLYYTYPVTDHIYPVPSEIRVGRAHLKGVVWFQAALLSQDQLRQRMAWALAQIFVIGQVGSNKNGYPIQWLNFYDILVRNAFGNYRDVLQEVTQNAKMGYYLTYLNNQKASGNRLPDENYAREVMQLFTVGLWHLNMDGTLKLDANQEPIPTYDNVDITELAKVFTGLQYAYNKPEYDTPNRVDPMIVRNENRHDRTEKTMLDGTVLSAGVNAIPEITAALDVLFNHPNVPPFISFRLIQRLVSSNPSAEYVERVARVFADNGEGVRGDLNAVVKAILLDPEARDAGYMINNGRGKLQEPLLRFTHLCRAFKLKSNEANGNILWFTSYEDEFGQSPYRSPSVFNFYLPDFVPSGGTRRDWFVWAGISDTGRFYRNEDISAFFHINRPGPSRRPGRRSLPQANPGFFHRNRIGRGRGSPGRPPRPVAMPQLFGPKHQGNHCRFLGGHPKFFSTRPG